MLLKAQLFRPIPGSMNKQCQQNIITEILNRAKDPSVEGNNPKAVLSMGFCSKASKSH